MRKYLLEKISIGKIDEINAKFRYGSVRMTPMTRVVLFLLKIYVLLMGVLLVVKFIQILSGGGE